MKNITERLTRLEIFIFIVLTITVIFTLTTIFTPEVVIDTSMDEFAPSITLQDLNTSKD